LREKVVHVRNDEYQRMFSVEGDFWWYRGLRELLVREIRHVCRAAGREAILLDAGCGTGANLQALREVGRGVGVDFSSEALRLARSRGLAHLVRGKVQELPIRDAACDVLMSIDVLYHKWIEDDMAVLREYRRVLAPGGWLIVHVAAHEWLRGAHDEVVMTRHRYTRRELVNKVEAAGFRVRRATCRNSLLLPVMLARRLVSSERGAAQSDLAPLPSWLNSLLLLVIRLENQLLRVLDFPVGGSVFVVAHRPSGTIG
jgi:ubiquinone/menaquinone biosynthesis C-methylase UbiE